MGRELVRDTTKVVLLHEFSAKMSFAFLPFAHPPARFPCGAPHHRTVAVHDGDTAVVELLQVRENAEDVHAVVSKLFDGVRLQRDFQQRAVKSRKLVHLAELRHLVSVEVEHLEVTKA